MYSTEETKKDVFSSHPKLCLKEFIAKNTATDQLRALSENSITGSELIRRYIYNQAKRYIYTCFCVQLQNVD